MQHQVKANRFLQPRSTNDFKSFRAFLTMFKCMGKTPGVFDNRRHNNGGGGLWSSNVNKYKAHARRAMLVNCDRGGLARPWEGNLGLEQEVIHGKRVMNEVSERMQGSK